MSVTLIDQYNEIVGAPVSPFATQDELDQIGHLLDEMERVEVYMESDSCTSDEYDECHLERLFLADQLDYLIAKV